MIGGWVGIARGTSGVNRMDVWQGNDISLNLGFARRE